MSRVFLSMSNDGKAIEVSWLGEEGTTRFTTMNEFADALAEICARKGIEWDDLMEMGMSCSSSMNWPKEYTDDPKLIRLCDEIMGAPSDE